MDASGSLVMWRKVLDVLGNRSTSRLVFRSAKRR